MSPKREKIDFNPQKDLITIPNAMTTYGGFLTYSGAENADTAEGFVKVAIGRAIDVADGFVARTTGQESDFGAALDAGTDKLVTAKYLSELWQKDLAPKPAIAAITAANLANAALTADTLSKNSDDRIRPAKTGKLALFTESVSLFAYNAGAIAEKNGHEKAAKTLKTIGHTALAASIPLAIHTTAIYAKRSAEAEK